MSRRDIRPTWREKVWRDPDLTYGQKAFLIRASELPAESDADGVKVKGSRPMGMDGMFALSMDYVAREMGRKADSVRRARDAVVPDAADPDRNVWLYPGPRGAFGRPNSYQAVIPNAVKNCLRYVGGFSPRYADDESAITDAVLHRVTYKAHSSRNHEPSSGDSPGSAGQEQAQQRRDRHPLGSFPANDCQWHEHIDCPPDCANAHHNTGSREATA